jgi:hypothetical protein
METPTPVRKIKCKGCNSWKENVYYILQDGPFCTDCLKKKYREFFEKEGEHKQK